jgi:hypothetical protein
LTRLGSVALRGVQVPSVSLVPRAADTTEAVDAADLAGGYGLVADEWQALVLEGWLGLRRDGKWSSPRCGLAVPRQNGKNGILEIRELYGLVLRGEKFLHTAHEVKTARKAFARLLSFFDNERVFPELAALVTEVRRTNGQEAIYLANGGSVEFIARSKGSGRGFTVDVLVCDEAQDLSDDALAALLPTISAAPLGNPQTILTGTPPTVNMAGEVWTRMRESAHAKQDTRLCWHEWSCERDVDLDDVANVARANPAIPTRLSLETIADERAAMDDATFGRERLGIWEAVKSAGGAVSPASWADTLDAASAADLVAAFAVDVAVDRQSAAIGTAGKRADGLVHVEVVDHHRGTGWVVGRCVELDGRHGPCSFVVDKGGPAASLIPDMKAAGLAVVEVGTGEVAASYGLFVDALAGRTLRHGPQPELDAAADGAKTRPCGDGGFAFGRKASGADISPLVAVSLAHWAAVTETGDLNPINNVW